MAASGSTPLCARSILSIPKYMPYGTQIVVSRVSRAILTRQIGQTKETIRSKIEELTNQVFDAPGAAFAMRPTDEQNCFVDAIGHECHSTKSV